MTFETAVKHILHIELGYANDPHDPGGPTNYGISSTHHPNEDIDNMTPERATEIYREEYWDLVRGDELPPIIRLLVLDSAVNQGVDPTIKMLQTVLRVEVDGIFGPITMKRMNSYGNKNWFLKKFCSLRMRRYANTQNWNRYATSWVGRVLYCYKETCLEKV